MRLGMIGIAMLLTGASQDSGTWVIQPGQWETLTRFSSVELPADYPEEMAEQMRAESLRENPAELRCVTPAQAANPTSGLVDAEAQGCSYDEVVFAEGRIRLHGVCPGPEGQGQLALTWSGSYSETSMQSDIVTEMRGRDPEFRMLGTISSRRIGDCPVE